MCNSAPWPILTIEVGFVEIVLRSKFSIHASASDYCCHDEGDCWNFNMYNYK